MHQLARAIRMFLPFRPPDELASKVLNEKELRCAVDLHQLEPRHATVHRTRQIHRRPRASVLQLHIRRVSVISRQRDRRQAFAKRAVIVEPRMRDRRDEQLKVRRSEHDAMILRADAVMAARRKREAELLEIARGGVEIAYRDHRVINGELRQAS